MTDTAQLRKLEPFVVRHYTGDEFPSIKGNGFDGLTVGEDREEAEQFVKFVNDTIERLTAERDAEKLMATTLRTAISQPDCRGCLYLYSRYDEARTLITEAGPFCKDCTNGDKFQALPKVVLYKVTV